MHAHTQTWELQNASPEDIAVKGAIAYIEKQGKDDGKRLLETLETVQPSVAKLRSLVEKGQVFDFDDYSKCQKAVEELIWYFDRLHMFRNVIASPMWSREHPQVLMLLQEAIAMVPEDIYKNIQDNNDALLKFASEAYKRIYG